MTRTGHVGWVGVLVVMLMWGLGWVTSTEPLVVGTTRTGQLSWSWLLLHGLLIVGAASSVVSQRLPARQGIALGTLLGFVSAVGVGACRLVPSLSADHVHMAPIALVVLVFGLGATMVTAGVVGASIGACFVPTMPTSAEPLVFEGSDGSPEHLPPTLREGHAATRIARATLEGGRGRLSTTESTVAFAWVQSMVGLDVPERERLRWLGVEVEPMLELVDGSIAPKEARARLLDAMAGVLARLDDGRARPSYRWGAG